MTSSVLGSIGVISAGFGFTDFIHRHGIERRVRTAGRSKSMMDPFRPETPEDVARLERLLVPIHQAFKDQVVARRGNRLPADRDLFTGEIWAGREAVELGLADGIAHLVPKMRRLRRKGPLPDLWPARAAAAPLWHLGRRGAGRGRGTRRLCTLRGGTRMIKFVIICLLIIVALALAFRSRRAPPDRPHPWAAA